MRFGDFYPLFIRPSKPRVVIVINARVFTHNFKRKFD
jgi:hypothetical protein